MTRRLPPFGPLIAFDAVARLRSFTRAGDDLGVTQSAISHQMRRLEDFFGVQLLHRLNPGVELTDSGIKLQTELAILLDGFSGLQASVRRQPERRTLRLGAGSSLANWWLVRRLQLFRELRPDIDIDFMPVESEASTEPPLDVRLLWTSSSQAHATSLQAPLFQECVFPVCAPSLLPHGKPLADAAALLDLPLVQKGHAPSGEWSWSFWFGKLGLKGTEPRGLALKDMGLCLTAAAQGAGVAIGRSLLVADAIAEGRLVPALAMAPQVLSTKVHVARWSADLVGDRSTQMLVSWLTKAAERSHAALQST